MEPFHWVDGERLIAFGREVLAEAPALLAERGFEDYALLTTDRALAAAPALEAGAAVVLPVPHAQVPEAAAAVRGSVGGSPLVALGGGRVIDAAKAIAGADGLECAAIPTTLSGAEITRIHRMPAGVEHFTLVRPSLVVADPALMASQPARELAASAMNALGHAIEPLYVPSRHPVAELAALRAAEAIACGLTAGEPDRDELALGALLAAYALGSTGFAVHHVICQTLVRVAGTPHAQTNAVMLPHTVALMELRVPEAMGRLATALARGRADAPGEWTSAVELVEPLAARAGPRSLSELRAKPAVIPEVVAEALARPQLAATPDPPGADELEALLQAAF